MSETKFTPGPWKIKQCKDFCGYENCKYHWVEPPGHFTQGSGFEQADANLIAAAPDLYNALEVLEKAANERGIPTDAAKAALAKARGEHAHG